MKNQNNLKDLQDDLDKVKGLEILAKSDGGQLLIKSLKEDTINAIESLTMSFPTLTHIELVSGLAKVREKLLLLKTLTNAKGNVDFLTNEIRSLLEDKDANE